MQLWVQDNSSQQSTIQEEDNDEDEDQVEHSEHQLCVTAVCNDWQAAVWYPGAGIEA